MWKKYILLLTITTIIYGNISCQKIGSDEYTYCFFDQSMTKSALEESIIGEWKIKEITSYEQFGKKLKFDKSIRLIVHSDGSYIIKNKDASYTNKWEVQQNWISGDTWYIHFEKNPQDSNENLISHIIYGATVCNQNELIFDDYIENKNKAILYKRVK